MLPLGHLRLWVLRLCVASILLDAAMPLMAAATAHVKGVAVGELCHRLGVALPGQASTGPSKAGGEAHHGHAASASKAAGDSDATDAHDPVDPGQCASRGLAPHAVGKVPALGALPPLPVASLRDAATDVPHHGSPDAVILWARALAHAPPARA